MDYFYQKTDSHGYIHSIDNLIIEYYIESVGVKCLEKIISEIQQIRDEYSDTLDYWEKLNCVPCSRYGYYAHHIHLDNGIYVQLGHYLSFDRVNGGKPDVFPLMQLQVNPNKHYGKPVLQALFEITDRYCYGASLVKYDYAIDIPVMPDDVQDFGSRKEKGLYKGTRYYGQRNKNGYCKIYDKQKEQSLDHPLTRVEHTVCLTKGTKELSLEPIYIRKEVPADRQEKLSKTDAVLVEFSALCLANGLDYESILNKLEVRKRRSIMEHLASCRYEKLDYDRAILDDLLEHVKKAFHFGGGDGPMQEKGAAEKPDDDMPEWMAWDLKNYGKTPFDK